MRELPGADRRCVLTMVAGQVVYRRGRNETALVREDEALLQRYRERRQ